METPTFPTISSVTDLKDPVQVRTQYYAYVRHIKEGKLEISEMDPFFQDAFYNLVALVHALPQIELKPSDQIDFEDFLDVYSQHDAYLGECMRWGSCSKSMRTTLDKLETKICTGF